MSHLQSPELPTTSMADLWSSVEYCTERSRLDAVCPLCVTQKLC
ncbi:hypothetical protein FOXG_20320 [Fusarium oxysporum f. sp. lycopersici 4287]|uniref:Uncharacterized protein n=2 Tax=Fusarium oxysporum TaxID=5507 RepID=A0A0J9VHE1_FUSO4|nr:hypothetical protein FOXG_20320 [Fusarium oxysporum f. sp. lycopersici 4287]EXK40471.1 hypothetical protein FOMG_07318 [Fusarium oxysporum f. sp. melonis 26406]KNB10251.1 hypothetical protein FOXG_20320 [Fusarium oxysporum f. sp. lycopersici 4287]